MRENRVKLEEISTTSLTDAEELIEEMKLKVMKLKLWGATTIKLDLDIESEYEEAGGWINEINLVGTRPETPEEQATREKKREEELKAHNKRVLEAKKHQYEELKKEFEE